MEEIALEKSPEGSLDNITAAPEDNGVPSTDSAWVNSSVTLGRPTHRFYPIATHTYLGERAKQVISSYLGMVKIMFCCVCDSSSNQMIGSILTKFCKSFLGAKFL